MLANVEFSLCIKNIFFIFNREFYKEMNIQLRVSLLFSIRREKYDL